MEVVIIDDESFWIEQIKKFIIANKIKLHITSFNNYNNELHKIINNKIRKIYIIDIRLENSKLSGYDIAREIREKAKDWESVIIFSSAFDIKSTIITDRLGALTYISKGNDFDENIIKSLKLALSIVSKNKFVTIKADRLSYQLLIDDIFYIEKEKNSKYCFVKTSNNIFRVRSSLKQISEKLEFEPIKNFLLINNHNVILKNDTQIIFKDKSKYLIK